MVATLFDSDTLSSKYSFFISPWFFKKINILSQKIDSENPDNGSDTASEDSKSSSDYTFEVISFLNQNLVLDTMTMSNWPVINSEAEIERDRLASTHKPIELPAYDLNGDLIHPILCNSALAGAIARVTFTLNHWYIENSSKDHN